VQALTALRLAKVRHQVVKLKVPTAA